jgi:FecR protein
MIKGIAGLLSGVMLAGSAWSCAAPAIAQTAPPPPPPYAVPGSTQQVNPQPVDVPLPNQAPNTPPATLPAAPRQGNPDVARVSVIDRGSMIIQRADGHKQVNATVNAPLLPGDFVSTQPGTRVEIQLDGYTMLRLNSNVQARIVKNEPSLRTIQLAGGTIELAILHEDPGATNIDTPSVTIHTTGEGNYRITVGADGSTTATARTGNAALIGGQQRYELASGKTLVATGPASNPRVTSIAEVGYDAFDDFNVARDKVLFAAIQDEPNVPQSIAGYDNLNQYGKWMSISPYGNVWLPNVGSDWAPYRHGQWTWESGFGWVWVGTEPWGWVPYHYGRWFFATGYGWAWVPPASTVGDDPTWYPALVGFFGYGDGGDGSDTNGAYDAGYGDGFLTGLAVGFGFFGWAPLAPYEAFNPWYPGYYNPNRYRYYPQPGRNPIYGTPRNGFGPRLPPRPIGSVYRNARFGGATAIDARSFHNGDFSRAIAVDPKRVPSVSPVHGEVPIAPSEANLNFTHAAAVTNPVHLSPVFSQPRFASNPEPVRTEPVRTEPVARQPETPVREPVRTTAPAPAPAGGAWGRFDQGRGTELAPQARLPESTLPESHTAPVERDYPVDREPSTGHVPYPMAHSAPAPGTVNGSNAGTWRTSYPANASHGTYPGANQGTWSRGYTPSWSSHSSSSHSTSTSSSHSSGSSESSHSSNSSGGRPHR